MLKSNTANKIISVIIAILLWTYVIGMVDPTKTTTIRDVPVQLLNEDSLTSKGLALSGEMDYTALLPDKRLPNQCILAPVWYSGGMRRKLSPLAWL
jgi:hypothetical protein